MLTVEVLPFGDGSAWSRPFKRATTSRTVRVGDDEVISLRFHPALQQSFTWRGRMWEARRRLSNPTPMP
jgi:hypothetical protein